MRKLHILGLLALIIVSSGCIESDTETESEGKTAIEIEELTVNPQEIYSGSSTNAILHVRNTGELDAELRIDSDWSGDNTHPNKGDRLLTNRCRDIFEVDEFTARGPGDQDEDLFELPSGTEARFSWSLNSEEADVPIIGLSCEMKFQVPFDYSVNAFRQLQFVESREIPGTPELESRSSRGPMILTIETIGSTSEKGGSSFIEGDNPEIIVRLSNQIEDESSYTGFIRARNLEIEASGFEFENDCEEKIRDMDQIVMYEGQSQPFRCIISQDVFEDLDASKRGRVEVSAEYTYVKDLGSRTVEVESRGN